MSCIGEEQMDVMPAGGTASTEPASTAAYRVAFVNTHPIQYFAPLYRYLTHNCGLDTTALYLSDFSIKGGIDPGFKRSVTWDIDLLDGYRPQFMGEAASRRRIGGFFSMVAPQLWPAIQRGQFDALVVHGHNLAAHHVALAAALRSRTAVFARAETHIRLTRSNWRQTLREPILKSWYRAFDGFLAIGTANRRYYEAMGVPADRIELMPYTVDNERFIAASVEARVQRQATRTSLGIRDSRPTILYASKFEERKRPHDLLEAFARLRAEGHEAALVMVGSGLLEESLRAKVAGLGLTAHVVFPGFVNQSELPNIYAACDVFVLPSENEPWGLVVNEAMCAGLPIVLSEEIGCAEDLVQTGVNGATFKARDVAGLADALRPILVDSDLRSRYGSASRDRISRWSYRECGSGLRRAIESAKKRDARKGADGQR